MKEKKQSDRIQVSLSTFDPLVLGRLNEIAEGGRLGHAARRELQRYAYLNNWTLREVRELGFSVSEFALIADILNGVQNDFQISPRSQLIREVTFAIEEGYAKKWKVNITDFQQKISQLTEAQAAAIIDAIERWWAGDYDDPDRDTTQEGFAKVGLMTRETDSSP